MKGLPFTLAIDDADSGGGGCTTHLLGLLLMRIKERIALLDLPLLVRLAPGVPWKTRGNAAVVLRGVLLRDDPEELVEEAYALALEYSQGRPPEPGKGPGVALYPGARPWEVDALKVLYRRAITDLVSPETARRVALRAGVRVVGSRGAVGAVAALAALGPGEPFTYELIAYRRPENWGRERCVRDDPGVEARIPPCTFNNVDLTSGRTIAVPHGPDPVLAGFRGACREWLGCYAPLLCEEPHFWLLYRSNQHTSPYSWSMRFFPYSSRKLEAKLLEAPSKLPGGHTVALALVDSRRVFIAAYREAWPLNHVLGLLRVGDRIVVEATAKPRSPGLTLSLEAIQRVILAGRTRILNPRCPKCGTRMKSMGRGKGFRCPKCGFRLPEASRITVFLPPPITSARITPRPGQLSHLTLPAHGPPLPTNPPGPVEFNEVFSVGASPPRKTKTNC